jgi:1-phosphatidylinositol-4-phosphate 5-kinase
VLSPAYNDFRFRDFCPKYFAEVRAMHSITAADYARSFETTCRERFSEGRSGAFMFYSSDQRYIVKTMTREESLALHSIMPLYVAHLDAHPSSLLVRFLGSHCITMYGVEIFFVVMLNVFPVFQLSERYDLKGSWVARHGFKGSRRTKSERKRRAQVSAGRRSRHMRC